MVSLLSIHDSLDDHRLVQRAATVIGVPRAEVTGNASFVLHAPLELLARAALLPHVRPEARDQTRARIAVLADLYDQSGPPKPPARPAVFDSITHAADALAQALSEGDGDGADAAAAWLGDHVRHSELPALLGATSLPCLEAAGHANIYLSLVCRAQPGDRPQQTLRHPASALVSSNPRSILMPATTSTADPMNSRLDLLLTAVVSTVPIGPAPRHGIAALVEHAQTNGVFDRLTDDDGIFRSPQQPPFALLRFAAHAMLQGPVEQAPYGWTHCLTLAQAPLMMAAAGVDHSAATYISAAYLAAHWATLGHRTIDLNFVPDRLSVDLVDALDTGPDAAAAAAWHTTDPSEVAATLATVASANHDAHRVKYTLACLDAAATDRAATRLYLASAAYLNAHWHTTPDETDPMPQLATTPIPNSSRAR